MIFMVFIVVSGMIACAALSWVLAFLVVYGKVILGVLGIASMFLYGAAFVIFWWIRRKLAVRGVLTKEQVIGSTGNRKRVLSACRAALVVLLVFCAVMSVVGLAVLLVSLAVL